LIASRIAITLGVALRETAREKRKIDFFLFCVCLALPFCCCGSLEFVWKREDERESAKREPLTHKRTNTRLCG